MQKMCNNKLPNALFSFDCNSASMIGISEIHPDEGDTDTKGKGEREMKKSNKTWKNIVWLINHENGF